MEQKSALFFSGIERSMLRREKICSDIPMRLLDWKSLGSETKWADGSCLLSEIPYTTLKKEKIDLASVSKIFLIEDPYLHLQSRMISWYRKGRRRNAFAFYRHFRNMIDKIGVESMNDFRLILHKLQKIDFSPLYNPQIAMIDRQKRVVLIREALRKDFESCRILNPGLPEGEETPLERLNFVEHPELFDRFIEKDLEIYRELERGAFETRKEESSESYRVRDASKRPLENHEEKGR